jgi:hypothetical protein
MNVTWGETASLAKETVETSVELADAPDITWRRKAKYGPASGKPYSIRFSFVRYDGGAWQGAVTIYAQRQGIPIGDWFSPGDVIDPPQWLTDLIAEATPAA